MPLEKLELVTKQTHKCKHSFCSEPRLSGAKDGYCSFHSDQNGQDDETARQVWNEARTRVLDGRSDFHRWHFPRDPKKTNGAFHGLTFNQAACFDHARFESSAGFSSVTFKNFAAFNKVVFEEDAVFTKATFRGEANFADAEFRSDAVFIKTSFEEDAHFIGASFEASVNWFAGCMGTLTVSRPWWQFRRQQHSSRCPWWQLWKRWPLLVPFPFREREQGAAMYRTAKQCAQDSGDYRSAGDYHYYEQCAVEHGQRKRTEYRPWRRAFWFEPNNPLHCWLEFIFARCLFGYGEKPIRVLATGILVIFLCTAVYWASGGIAGTWRFTDCLYFSAVTFTTLGYGDFEPAAHMRWLAGLEAFSGAVLMALFVVALAKKYAR